MISRWFPLTLFAFVFAPGLLHAQQPSPNAPQRSVGMTFLVDASAGQIEKMYEDIEVLRRILDRKLTPLYPSVPSKGERAGQTNYGTLFGPVDANTGAPIVTPGAQYQIPTLWGRADTGQPYLLDYSNSQYPATIPLRSLEGTYLKGHGVVYTATLSSLHLSAKTVADSPVNVIWDAVVVQQVTEWDSIRRQVRNEKEAPKKPEASKSPSLSDVLLKVLADNGHHFSQLGENESLTIILTVHEESPSSHAAKSGGGGPGGSAKAGSQFKMNSTIERQFEVNDLEMLGELHLKQGHFEEAIKAFQRAVERKPDPNALPTLYRKLAQCYLALGQDEKAQEVLDQLHSLLKGASDVKDKQPRAAKPAAALPMKLIVSAPKKLLDQVKEGKITFEDFRRQASVETLRFGDRR